MTTVDQVSIPRDVFEDVLRRVHDLGELKAVLVVHATTNREGKPGVWIGDLLRAGTLHQLVAGQSPEPAEERARRNLDRAVTDGFLYRVAIDDGRQACYLPVTESNRILINRVRAGDEDAARALDLPADSPAAVYRPNVYAFYEQHIGPLTPLVAEHLRLAERAYPRAWIEEAVLAAAQNNRRSWRYIESILLRWEETGAPRGISG